VVVLVYVLLFVMLEPREPPPRSSYAFSSHSVLEDAADVDVDMQEPEVEQDEDADEESKINKGGRPVQIKQTTVISENRMCFPAWTDDEIRQCDVRTLVEEIMYYLLFVIYYYSVIVQMSIITN
jgi:hypothetical protein